MKTNRNRWIVVAVTIMLVTGLAIAAPGHGRHRHHHGVQEGMGQGFAHMAEELGLEEAQLEEIRGIVDSRRAETEPLMTARRDAQARVRELTHAENLDEQALRDAVLAAAEVSADLAVQRARTFQAMMSVLTPEQQTQAREKIQQRAEFRPRNGKGRGLGRGPGF